MVLGVAVPLRQELEGLVEGEGEGFVRELDAREGPLELLPGKFFVFSSVAVAAPVVDGVDDAAAALPVVDGSAGDGSFVADEVEALVTVETHAQGVVVVRELDARAPAGQDADRRVAKVVARREEFVARLVLGRHDLERRRRHRFDKGRAQKTRGVGGVGGARREELFASKDDPRAAGRADIDGYAPRRRRGDGRGEVVGGRFVRQGVGDDDAALDAPRVDHHHDIPSTTERRRARAAAAAVHDGHYVPRPPCPVRRRHRRRRRQPGDDEQRPLRLRAIDKPIRQPEPHQSRRHAMRPNKER
mmetsp:Transcript_24313/g.78532  ORF Transcript_24313/g.78532 Transcript_24313/m.78532 type:complete len:302 (-) Transcript_24313:64-969(-)